jgi:peptide/nickel transport system substrate-binding protein
VTSFRAAEGIRLERNEGYWGRKPSIMAVECPFMPEATSRQLAARSGEIDGTFDIPPEQAVQWQQIGQMDVNFAPGMIVTFLSFDLSQEPWNDIHVRRAFAHALDRPGLVKALLRGYGQAANSVVPPAQWSGLLSPAATRRLYSQLKTYPFSLEKAKQELAQSSVPDGFSASVIFPATNQTLGKALLTLAQNLKRLNIELEVKETPSDVWLAKVYSHKDLGLIAVNFLPDYPDPTNYLLAAYPSDQAKPNGFNCANFRNARVDRLLRDQTRAEPARRARMLAEVLKISQVELPYLPIYWVDTAMAVNRKFKYRGFTSVYYYQQWIRNLRPA